MRFTKKESAEVADTFQSLIKVLERIEYAANKASLTDSERLLDIRVMVQGAMHAAVGGAK